MKFSAFVIAGFVILSLNPIDVEAAWGASLTVTSNYVYRGYSKSHGHPVVQGNLDYEFASGVYVGTWASQVDFGDSDFRDRAHVEINPYIGWHYGLTNDWRVDATLARYFFDGKIFGRYSDYNEIDFSLRFKDLITAKAAFSESSYHRGGSVWDYELIARYPVTDTIEFSTGVGYNDSARVLDYSYLYWNTGFTWSSKYLAFDIRYFDANRLSQGEVSGESTRLRPPKIDNHVVFSISIGF